MFINSIFSTIQSRLATLSSGQTLQHVGGKNRSKPPKCMPVKTPLCENQNVWLEEYQDIFSHCMVV